MPAPARPVSIEEDLGLDPPPPPRGLQAPPSLVFDSPSEAQAASPAPEDGAVQPLRARRWRAHILLQPLAQQPTSRPLASFALPLAAAQGICCPGFPLLRRFLSFGVVAPCMAADFTLLAESLMAFGALSSLSKIHCSIHNKLLP